MRRDKWKLENMCQKEGVIIRYNAQKSDRILHKKGMWFYEFTPLNFKQYRVMLPPKEVKRSSNVKLSTSDTGRFET